ncbi:MAG TPA: cytidine deaminase [bacterium]|nr:cytidine deaminase [bacterium]
MPHALPIDDARSLLEAAREAMSHSHAVWSQFPVGAALRCADGTIFTGCNVESPSLLQGACAERVALLKALSEGQREFTHIAIVAEKRPAISPCGLCRQMLYEFAPDLIVIVENQDGEPIQEVLAAFLPEPFVAP